MHTCPLPSEKSGSGTRLYPRLFLGEGSGFTQAGGGGGGAAPTHSRKKYAISEIFHTIVDLLFNIFPPVLKVLKDSR